MLKIFVDTTAFEMEEIEKALHKNEFMRVKELSHKLKTSFLYFDLIEIAEIFQQIEKHALSNKNPEFNFKEAKEQAFKILESFKENIIQLENQEKP
ncbi:MAG: Hpt domain-containing protein [Cytophagales bacterium]